MDVAALVNCGWLLILEILVIGAVAERLLTRTPQVHGLPVLIVSGVAVGYDRRRSSAPS